MGDKMKAEVYQKYLQMMNQWLILEQEGKNLEKFFLIRNYRKIAIYGMAIYGRHLVRELENGQVKVMYGIDQKELKPYKNVEIYHLTDQLPTVDLVVNTVLQEHESIKMQLENYYKCPVISLEDVVFDSYE